jgi:hypothetical protein
METTDIKAESFSLKGGGATYSLTHVPSGLRVVDAGPGDLSAARRWERLETQLADLLRDGAGNRKP